MSLVKFAAAAAFNAPPLYRIRTTAQENRGKPVPIQPVITSERLDLCNRYFDYEHQPSEFNLPLNGSMRQLAHG